MTIFDIINSVFFSKKKIDLSLDNESTFSPFMLNRWMSMYSEEMVNIINNTSNKYGGIFNIKQQQYDWYYYLFPKLRFKKIQYIKKTKKEKELKEDNLSIIAKNNEISVRELKLYKEFFDS